MGVPTSEVGYTPAMPRREYHEVHKGHVVALKKKNHSQLPPTWLIRRYYVSNGKGTRVSAVELEQPVYGALGHWERELVRCTLGVVSVQVARWCEVFHQ